MSLTPAQARILTHLLKSPATRAKLDLIGHVANAPDEIFRLRQCGFDIPCQRIPCRNQLGEPTNHGLYSLTADDVAKATQALRVEVAI